MNASLGSVCSFLNGGTPSRSVTRYFEGDVAWITGADILGPIVNTARDFITEEAIRDSATNRVPAGTVLLVTRTSVGKVAVAARELCFSQDITAITPDLWKLDTGYLVHFLRTKQRHFERLARGATIRGVTREVVADTHIPLPPLPQQRRIAEILDKADSLQAKRRAALAQLDTLTQSIFLDMFGDPANILDKWPRRRLGELLAFLTSGSRGWAEHYSEAGDVFLRIQNVRRDELSLEDIAYVRAPDTAEAKRTRVEPGDVLLSITADLGRTAVVPEGIGRSFINQHLSILRTKALVPRFLSAYLSSPVGQRQVSGRNRHGVKAGLNFDDIRSLVVPLPPPQFQHEFANRVTSLEKLKTTYRASVTQLDALFASLQHRAFRGEL